MRSKMFRKSHSQLCKNQKFLLLYIGAVVLFVYIVLFYEDFVRHGQYHKDLRYLVSDSFEIEKLMSGKVLIDNEKVFEVDTFCGDVFFRDTFNLNEGEHIIQLISTNNRYCFSDTIATDKCKLIYGLIGFGQEDFNNNRSVRSLYVSQKLYFGSDIRHSRIKLFKRYFENY